MEIIKERERKRKKVIERARKWVSTIDLEVSAILIGSYARGDFNLWSDVDILLISDAFEGSPLERLKKIDPPPGFQVIPLNIRELKELCRKDDILIKEVSRHGIILRDDLHLGDKLLFCHSKLSKDNSPLSQ